ncbi:MAG: peptidylprolyl isomerase [bacterium]
MMKKYFSLILLFLVIPNFFGCTQKKDPDTTDAPPKNNPQIILKLNGEPIPTSEFIDFFHSRPRIAHWNSSEGELDPNEVLQGFIDKILMIQDAMGRGFHNSPEVLSQKDLFERREAVNLMIKKHIDASIIIDDEEVLAKIPPAKRREVKFRRLLLLSEEKAKEMEEKLRNGTSFDELVRSESMGEEASNGGYMDFLNPHRGIYPQEVINTIFALPLGEYSPPMKIREGFAIFQPLAERPIPHEDLKPVLDYQRALLFKDKQSKILNDMINELKNYQQIHIDEEQLRLLFKNLKAGDTSLNNNPIIVTGKDIKIYWKDIVSSVPNIKELASDEVWIKNLLDSILRRQLLTLEAEKRGFKEDPQLKKKSRRFVEDIISRQLIMEEVESKIAVTDEDCKKYYKDNFNQAVSFEEIKSKIRQTLIQEKREREFKKFLAYLGSKATIYINKESFNEIRKSLE